MAKEQNTPDEALENTPSPDPQKYRVVHGAVGGTATNKKGETVECDYYRGAIVTDRELDNQAAFYLTQGAIEPIE